MAFREREEKVRDRKVKRMKVLSTRIECIIMFHSHLTWSTLGVLSACSFDTRILTMLSKNIKLI